jgi:hypothetical protein
VASDAGHLGAKSRGEYVIVLGPAPEPPAANDEEIDARRTGRARCRVCPPATQRRALHAPPGPSRSRLTRHCHHLRQAMKPQK